MRQETHASLSDTLVDVAYHRLRRDITEEYLPAGEKINLSDLCGRYEVSSTPIKQALNRLITEGLVESVPHKGFRVRAFRWPEFDELFELRLMMESHFAPQAISAVAANPLLSARFEKNIRDNLALVESFQTADEYFRAYELDQQFHELLILSSGNRSALRVYKSLNTHAYAAYLFGKQPRSLTVKGIGEHRAIYEALRAGDEETAQARIRAHIENARAKIRLSLKLRQNTCQA